MFSDLIEIRNELELYFRNTTTTHLQQGEQIPDHKAPPIEYEDKECYGELSPRNVSGESKVDNYFICKICLKIVKEPRECSKCETAFCKGCLDQWNRNTNMVKCPLRCEKPKFKTLHRFA